MFLIIGYSFPPADTTHLKSIFNPGAISSEAEGVVVNPNCPKVEYQENVRGTFPSISKWDFSHPDFRAYIATLRNGLT